MKAFTRFALGAVFCGSLAFFTGACARSPTSSGGDGTTRKFLIVNMTVRGQIQPQDAATPYYYFCVINRTDTISEPGPVPVVDRPWGNGFAAPAPNAGPDNQGFIGFVRYDRSGYRCFRVTGNATQGSFTDLGQPDGATAPQTGEKALSFRFDLNRLKLTPEEVEKRYVQINLIATNNLPIGAEDAAKVWDAFGDGRGDAGTGSLNAPITLDATQNIFRRNSDTNLEPANDVRDHLGPIVDDPNLDIVDWSVEIRTGD